MVRQCMSELRSCYGTVLARRPAAPPATLAPGGFCAKCGGVLDPLLGYVQKGALPLSGRGTGDVPLYPSFPNPLPEKEGGKGDGSPVYVSAPHAQRLPCFQYESHRSSTFFTISESIVSGAG